MSFSWVQYCQYLLSSQTNFSLTHLADHLPAVSHDAIRRFLLSTALSSDVFWEEVQSQLSPDPEAYLVFDDTVLDKDSSQDIEIAQRLYSGNAHQVLMGIGLISCLYVDSRTQEFWLIDYRIYNRKTDGNTKNDHVIDMLKAVAQQKKLPFRTVLTDCWYSSQRLMMEVDNLGKVYYCPLKANRLVDDSGGVKPYERVGQLEWSKDEQQYGKVLKIRGFPRDKKVKLFRVTITNDRTEHIATI